MKLISIKDQLNQQLEILENLLKEVGIDMKYPHANCQALACAV